LSKYKSFQAPSVFISVGLSIFSFLDHASGGQSVSVLWCQVFFESDCLCTYDTCW